MGQPRELDKRRKRRQLKQKVVVTRSERLRLKLHKDYTKKDMELKRGPRKDKREWGNRIAQEAEDAAKRGAYEERL